MMNKIAEKTKEIALLYFPVLLFMMAGFGWILIFIASLTTIVLLKLLLALAALAINGFAIYVAATLLVIIGRSIVEDEKEKKK